MIGAIFKTEIDHCRIEKKRHAFRYTGISLLLDIDQSKQLNLSAPLFGVNRAGLFSIKEGDYLPGKNGSLRERLEGYLAQVGLTVRPHRIELLTTPRFLGYVFNPVSFFLCYSEGEREPEILVAQVNNTFGESHLYLVKREEGRGSGQFARYSHPKEFHVSPFFDRLGEYEFLVRRTDEEIDLRVNLFKEGKPSLTSSVAGKLAPWSRWNLVRLGAQAPLLVWGTFPRIAWQAAKLKFQKQLEVYAKPIPRASMTIGRRAPTRFERLCKWLVCSQLRKLGKGELTLALPSRELLRFGAEGSAPKTTIEIVDWGFFPRVLLGGDIGFGESYVAGEWDAEDLTSVFQLFVENADRFNERTIVFTKLRQLADAVWHRLRSNSKRGSRENIRAHYDLGNELFTRFLDGRLLYSCAMFKEPTESLEEAQVNKLVAMIEKAKIRPGDHVLEIGSGWGAFAIEAVKRTGCRVTTITLSEQQFELANERVRGEGLQGSIEVKLCDYRDVQGEFDRIVSIEMLEAVGHENLGTFFANCDRLLKPDGVIAIQFISIPDQKYEQYRKSCDWIQRYIFPGGHCPSLSAVCTAASRRSSLVVEGVENIGPDYARTLKEWRDRFRKSAEELVEFGYDERFRRMWEYYLSYCEAGFATRTLGTLQIVFTRPNNKSLDGCPGY